MRNWFRAEARIFQGGEQYGRLWKKRVALRKRSGSAGTLRRDALSPRAAHPRLFQSHVADAPTTAPRRVPRPPHHILRLPVASYSSVNIPTRFSAMATPSSTATTPSPRPRYLHSPGDASSSTSVPSGTSARAADDRERVVQKLRTQAELNKVCTVLSAPALPSVPSCNG